MFEKLLIPIDFGPAGEAAVRFAKKIAAPGAEARLLHVVTNETTFFFADMMSLDRFVARAQKGLDEVRKKFHDDETFRMDTQIREGTIYREVLDEAERWKPDVVVLGSHGRRGLQRWLLGSVAERTLRGCDLPTCIVKDEVSDAPLGKVCLATDLEETMAEATECFRQLVSAPGRSGSLVHVFHAEHWLSMAAVPAPFVESVEAGGVPDTEIENRLHARRAEREQDLAKAGRELHEKGVDVEFALLDGEPWTELQGYVEKEGVELLVLGTHKYKALDRLILGSVAEKTLRCVHCPILVVPHHS